MSPVYMVPFSAFNVSDLFPLLEGPTNGVYHRIERPDDGVMLFAFDEGKLACWATSEPERWLGADPRDQIVYEDWDGTFERVDEEAGAGQGRRGRVFQDNFIAGLHMLGLQFEDNEGHSATVWDIHPKGEGWHRLIKDNNTNIKIPPARHLWTAGGAALYKKIYAVVHRADNGTLTREAAERRIVRLTWDSLKSVGVIGTGFMKPKTQAIEDRINRAVQRKDKAALSTLLHHDNFATKRLDSIRSIKVGLNWDLPYAGADNKTKGSWQGSLSLWLDAVSDGKPWGITGQIQGKGQILTVAWRDRVPHPAKPPHQVRNDESSSSRASTPRKPGEGATSIYGGFRFHQGHNKTRKPRKDVARSIQNRMNAKGGVGKKVRQLKKWHRSRAGLEMHKQLGRFNRQNNPRGESIREKIVDIRDRIARWRADVAIKGYVGESSVGFNNAGYAQLPNADKTLDDIFEGLLRKLVVMEALDVLQDVEFDDETGSIYLFFDPSLPPEEMDEVMRALQTEQSDLALVASPDRSLPDETVDSEWWVVFLPGKSDEGQAVGPDPRVYSMEQEPGSKVQMVQTGPPTSVEQLGQGIDVGKILKAMGGK